MTKDVLGCIFNPTYLIGYCDYTLMNLVSQDYCTNIQYNPQDKDVVNIATDWGDIIYDA